MFRTRRQGRDVPVFKPYVNVVTLCGVVAGEGRPDIGKAALNRTLVAGGNDRAGLKVEDISTRTLHIICPGLRHAAGHDLAYTLGIAAGAEGAGLGVRIHHPGHPDLQLAGSESQVWRMPADPRGAKLRTRVVRKAREMVRRTSYASIFKSMKPQDMAFAHTVGFREAFLLAAASGGRPFALLQRFDHCDDAQAIAAFRATAKLARKFGISLLTDSADLAQDFRQLSGRELGILPPPSPRQTPQPRTAKPTFGFLGAGRAQKGFLRLPDIITAIRRRLPDADFLIQCYSHPDDPSSEAAGRIRRVLGAMDGVKLVNAVTDDPQYAELLDQCSVVMTPYDALTYRRVTSRVFVEGLAAGAAVMTTPETWMARETARFQLERAFPVNFLNADDIGRAAKAALASVGQAAPNTSEWLQGHSFERLVATLLGSLER